MKELKPFQKWAVKKMKTHKIAGLFFTMGLGKTVTACQYIKEKNFKYTLIVSPKIIIPHWEDHLCDILKTDIVPINGKTSKHIEKYIKQMLKSPDPKDKTIFLTNYEFIRARKPLFKLIAALLNCIILDESNYIQNRKASVTKTVTRIFLATEYKIILTGTPFLNIINIYSQMKFLKYNFWGCDYWTWFFEYVNFVLETIEVNGRVVEFKKIIGPNKEKLPKLLRKIKKDGNAIFTEDVSGYEKLPKQSLMPVGIPLDEIMTEEIGLFKADLISEVGDVTNSIHAAGKMVKLQRIISGVHLKKNSDKFNLLTNMIDNEVDTEATPLIIWCRFTATIEMLQAKLSKKYKDFKVFTIDGSTKVVDRKYILKYVNSHNRCIVILQIQVGKFGLDLKTTSVGIFYELDFSLLNYTQCKGRIRRLSSKGSSINYILYYKETIDQYIFKALVKGLRGAAFIRSIYNDIIKH